MTPLELAIIRAVAYAALFDYPLTLDQLHETLIRCSATRDGILAAWRASARLRRVVDYRDGFFFPAGRAELVDDSRPLDDQGVDPLEQFVLHP